MAKARVSRRIAEHLSDRKAREAVELAVAAQQERAERMAGERAAALAARGADLTAILKPLADLVNADPEGVKAIARLRAALAKGRLHLSEPRRSSPGTPIPVSFLLGEQFNLRVPPYDSEWNWGNDRQHSSSKATGYVGIVGESGSVSSVTGDSVAAACGIGVAFLALAAGQAVVRTQVQYTWAYQVCAYGIGSSADARGGIDISAWQGGTLVSDVRRAQVFSDSKSTAGCNANSGSGSIGLTDLEITFPVAASTMYAVPVGAWVECNHSAGLGASRADGKVEGTVRCVVFDSTP
jgi:hypothetical protein